MDLDSDSITKREYDLIIKLRKINPSDYDKVYESISNLLDVLEKNE